MKRVLQFHGCRLKCAVQVKVCTSPDDSGVGGHRLDFEPSSVAPESPLVPLFLFGC